MVILATLMPRCMVLCVMLFINREWLKNVVHTLIIILSLVDEDVDSNVDR